MFDTLTKALPAMGIAALGAIAVAADGGYIMYRWMTKHRRAVEECSHDLTLFLCILRVTFISGTS